MNRVHVVIGLILGSNDKILISKRKKHLFQGGLWEFPGGKVEAGESSLDALRREIKEELGIFIIDSTPFMKFDFDYPEKQIFMDVWVVKKFSGDATGNEGQVIVWVPIDKLSSYKFPAADDCILENIKKL
jgi:8-oxo-dGTP diphosphatase|tara:strand:- start:8457 stop:8846 length:390 start_codon:yes stop_codon:yes gene_type:complete